MNQPHKIPISVLVQTKNEQVGISACLKSLGDFDEVIVIDSDSTDKTVEIALAHGAKVVNFTWNGSYPKKKQWQLTNLATRHDWVLFMDADESPTPELVRALRESEPERQASVFAAYDLVLDYVFAGRTLGHGHRVVKRALVDRRRVAFPVVDDLDAPGMGELEGHYQPSASGPIGQLRGRIRHDDKDPVRTWFDRHNRYSDWEAYLRTNGDARKEIASKRTAKGSLFDRVPFKPAVFFLYAYVLKSGFRDGRAGLDYALALSMYYWQIGVKTRELRRNAH
jgi:glycosyltransferase involved in cell wall biosynthesis